MALEGNRRRGSTFTLVILLGSYNIAAVQQLQNQTAIIKYLFVFPMFRVKLSMLDTVSEYRSVVLVNCVKVFRPRSIVSVDRLLNG